MQHLCRAIAFAPPLVASAAAVVGISSAHADIIGLAPGSYVYNQGDAGTAAIVGPSSIQLTTGASQARSIWFNTRQDISQFTATFRYQERLFSSNPGGTTAGIAFVLSNSPVGQAALGNAVTNGYSGITPSAAVVLNTIGGGSSFGFYRNGVLTNSDSPSSPIAFPSEHNIDVTVSYNGSLLSVTMVDGAATFGPQSFLVGSLASSLGSSTAYVGFTAGNGDISAYQILNGFTYAAPSPAAGSLLGCGGLLLLRRRR